MNFKLTVRPNIPDFKELYSIIYEICHAYYQHQIDKIEYIKLFKVRMDSIEPSVPKVEDYKSIIDSKSEGPITIGRLSPPRSQAPMVKPKDLAYDLEGKADLYEILGVSRPMVIEGENQLTKTCDSYSISSTSTQPAQSTTTPHFISNSFRIENLKKYSHHLQSLIKLFTFDILNEIKSCLITYIESILILYLEHKQPIYVKRLSSGTFNTIFQISLILPSIAPSRHDYALRISKDEICNINFKKIDWYDNLLYYNDVSLTKYLKFYPNLIDSSHYPHYVDQSSKQKYTHWSVSWIYSAIYDIPKYKHKYVEIVKHLLSIFEANNLLYFDWKMNNFMVHNDDLVLVDTDFENIYSMTAVCSTHRLTPDPSPRLNTLKTSDKINQATLLMYISAYLSMISVCLSTSLKDYYMSFKFINKLNPAIDNDSTIASTIKLVTNGEYDYLPIKSNEIKDILRMLKNAINCLAIPSDESQTSI